MTPVRAKRFSKVPNRFSSDNSRIETSSANGETIIDYNDKSTSTTHNLVPISKTIKLKPVIREPLKVKLPKLKRPANHHQAKEKKSSCLEAPEIRLHKIKLPSLNKKSKSGSSSAIKESLFNICKESFKASHDLNSSKPAKFNSSSQQTHAKQDHYSTSTATPSLAGSSCSSSNSSLSSVATTIKISSANSVATAAIPELDTSNTSSVSSEEQKHPSINASSSSYEGDSSGMQIVVSGQTGEQPSGSGIRCPCGVENDLGVMVECESCSTWQHGHCINIGSEDDAYEGYICAFCTLPPDRVTDSLRHLTVNDKFQPRFEMLESQIEDTKVQSGHEPNTAKIPRFTQEELTQALRELRRVLGSLKVKMAMLISKDYDTELQIWKNPNWSDKHQDINTPYMYIWDNYKFNLKMNVHNMMRKMKTRSRLIELALSQIEKDDKGSSDSGIDSLRLRNIEILENIRELESKYHDYSLTTRSSNACDPSRPQFG